MNSLTQKNVETRPISSLLPAKRNARTHSKRQVEQIARSIKKFGFTNPVLVDENNRVMAGHGRIEAAKSLGLDEVPCLGIEGMSEADKRAYVLADNKLALNAGWDMEVLASELSELIQLDFDVSLSGFEMPEVDALLVAAAESKPNPIGPEDQHLQLDPGKAITSPGDTWKLGRHLLTCGDAKNPDDVKTLVGDTKVDMVFTDPPYNVQIDGHVSGLGRTRHREFVEASGEMSPAQFTAFLSDSFENLERACRDGAIVYTCMDWRHLAEALAAGAGVFHELKNLCVWSKTNGGMGTFYRSQHGDRSHSPSDLNEWQLSGGDDRAQ